jgi:soluble lytic murein transglycosylase-like protein
MREDSEFDIAKRAFVSPPPSSGSDRVTEMLFQWETRHLSPLGRRMVSTWRSGRNMALLLTLSTVMFLVGAAATNQPRLEAAKLALERQMRNTKSSLLARQGELELARLELTRLNYIHEQSKRYRIPADLAGAIYDIALSERIDPALAFSLVRVESEFTRTAVSSVGAIGLTQLMPETASWLQPGITRNQIFERDVNLRLGFRYLRMLMEQYNGDLQLALLAYNRGPGRVDEIISEGGNPSNGYDRLVRDGARGVMD